MISEGSCDPEDWSNDAENSALTSQEYITFENSSFNCNAVSQYNCFTVFLLKYM